MISSIDLQDVREEMHGNLPELCRYLQQLEGQKFLFFRSTYAGEMTLHLGETLERSSAKLKNRTRGSYAIAFRGSVLRMLTAEEQTPIVVDPDRDLTAIDAEKIANSDLETRPPIQPDAIVAATRAIPDEASGGVALFLGFSDGTKLVICPQALDAEDVADPESQTLPEVADWEMFTPVGRYLTVGPGQCWAYLASEMS